MSLLSFLTGTTPQSEQDANLAALQVRSDAALARRMAVDSNNLSNVDNYDDTGHYVGPPALTQDQSNNFQTYANSVQNDSVAQGADQGFIEGAKQGLNNVLNAPGKVVAATGASQLLLGIVKGIPWWVWLAVLGAIFVRMGGGIWLAKRLKGTLAKL